MRGVRVWLVRLGVALAVGLSALSTTVAMAYEEPPYDVVAAHEGFELRRYAPMLVVETEMPGGREAGGNAAFRRLFDYISGNNRSQQKIEMTVPVLMAPAGQKIEMTVPVLTQPGAGGVPTMQFVLPSRWTPQTAPQPVDSALRLRLLPQQWLAVRRYSGRTSESNFREEADALLQALPVAGLTPTGPAQMAVYDGPFTLWFLRRNEALVPVAPPTMR
jgi:hypothetical protein